MRLREDRLTCQAKCIGTFYATPEMEAECEAPLIYSATFSKSCSKANSPAEHVEYIHITAEVNEPAAAKEYCAVPKRQEYIKEQCKILLLRAPKPETIRLGSIACVPERRDF